MQSIVSTPRALWHQYDRNVDSVRGNSHPFGYSVRCPAVCAARPRGGRALGLGLGATFAWGVCWAAADNKGVSGRMCNFLKGVYVCGGRRYEASFLSDHVRGGVKDHVTKPI